jgi:hypothetical protein
VDADTASEPKWILAEYLAAEAAKLKGDDHQANHVWALESMSQAVLYLPDVDEILEDFRALCIDDAGNVKPSDALNLYTGRLSASGWARVYLQEVVAALRDESSPFAPPSST